MSWPRSFQIVGALLLFGCSQLPQPVASPRTDISDLAARAREYSEAVVRASSSGWALTQVAALADFYTDDTVVFPPRGPEIRGREAVLSYWTRTPDRQILSHSIKTDRVDVDGDLAADHGTIDVTFQTGATSPESATLRFVSVWRRGPDGKWRKHLDTWW